MLLWKKDAQSGQMEQMSGEHKDRHVLFPGPGHECPPSI